MKPANITRASAQERSKQITAESYVVTVDLSGLELDGTPLADPENFISTSEIHFGSTGGASHVDLIADEVIEAWLDDEQLDVSGYDDGKLPFTTAAGEHKLIVVARCRYSHTGEGLHRFVDPADQKVYLYTQFETADARRVYANFEQPDEKATFQFIVIAPKHWTVVSNAQAVEPQEAANGNGVWEFAPTLRMSTYITALVAGDYHRVNHTLRTASGEMPASVLCRQSMVPFLDDERIMHTTQRGFDVFEKAFGHPYPFGSYDQIFVPEYNAGAMENAGCVTFRDEYLFRSRVSQDRYEARDNTILHELAHMWFGDLVTMTWWDDLWLNESFAEWASHYAMSQINQADGGVDPWVGFCNARKTWAYRQDQLPTTHPIAADMVDLEAVEQNFDGITYAKGASTLKQLVAQVGEQNFLAGVRTYFAEHAFGNTQLTDLLQALEKASGRDLGNFSAEWLETTGVNTLRADFDVDDQGNFTRFDVVQSADPAHPTLRNHRIAIGIFTLGGEGEAQRLERSHELEVDIAGERTPIQALVGVNRGDLVLLNDRDLSYAKVRLDERSLATLVGHIHQLTDPLARAVCWAAAWDMCRDAEMRSDDYLELVLRGIGSETDANAVSALRVQAQTAAVAYTPLENRPAQRARLTSGFAGLLKNAEPGSDHQLAFASQLIAAIDTPAGGELLKAWLRGEEVPQGLVVDQDLRWRIVSALARMGSIGEPEIAAEAQRDQTIAGQQSAAGARSALRDPQAKATAWHLATEDPTVPNGTHNAICGWFWSYGQMDMLDGYVDKYLDVARKVSRGEGMWASAGHAATQSVLLLLFPSPAADSTFLAKVSELVAEPGTSDQVRRVLTEQKDNAERALRVQEFSR